ncbi:hypothetical protein SAMN05660657_05373 [Geodermatophilus amargosae]|uniref:Uncharacterized protein n=1 Tax=Geodermatophilus amargosae TaxID=1296565 RepID=A0A1I7D6P2_9ACTN|nr:hypothetical protein [Geodermatophilus amargosae]SFU07244.1 hypothetical protein SAMN05660657_05373 [Geodermatophilus amargosae]
MPYDPPGRADHLPDDLVGRWNGLIEAAHAAHEPALGSRFFSLEPDTGADATTVQVGWFGDPAEPGFCLDPEAAEQLSDWGVRGRHELHNEYCEYAVQMAADANGVVRPKRVQVTTELAEYWLMLATWSPPTVRELVEEVLGVRPTWQELYGPGVSDPEALDPRQRTVAFATHVAGNGGDPELAEAGVPAQPMGTLNTANALFITHPINGLDDLLYIVMFGARPYARQTPDGFQPASREEIFRAFDVEHLACRHADPAAAMAAAGAAVAGRTVAFTNPLGMYLKSFTAELFTLDGAPVPDEWVRFSRGEPDRFQRLEFGPGDDDPHFLDDVTVTLGDVEKRVRGGYQVVRQLEVGPFVTLGPESPVADDERVVLQGSDEPIRCNEARACESVKNLQTRFEEQHGATRVAPRTMARDR